MFWLEKSKLKWLKDEDMNTYFFHKMVKIKKIKKNIITLLINGDHILTNPYAMVDNAIDYFNNFHFLFFKVRSRYRLTFDVIPNLVYKTMNNVLTMFPSSD